MCVKCALLKICSVHSPFAALAEIALSLQITNIKQFKVQKIHILRDFKLVGTLYWLTN
jgi:hypothetical protein